jgi:hypothetical protein
MAPINRTFVLATVAVPIVIYGLMPHLQRARPSAFGPDQRCDAALTFATRGVQRSLGQAELTLLLLRSRHGQVDGIGEFPATRGERAQAPTRHAAPTAGKIAHAAP